MAIKPSHYGDDIDPDPDFQDSSDNLEIAERADRLRRAVKAAGGNQAVATRSGMNLSTLNRYISGRDMKASAMIKLADACGVSLEWLAAGRGAMRPSDDPPPTPPKLQPPPLGLINIVNTANLAVCMEAAQGVFRQNGETPDAERLIRASLLIYDLLNTDKP